MRNRYSMTYTVGNIAANEQEMVWLPGHINTAKYGVVLCHGANAHYQFADVSRWGSVPLASRLAEAGIPCVAGAFGNNAFANDTAMSRIDAAITYLNAKAGVPTSKVHLIGFSMGGGTAFRYAQLNPTKAASVTGIMPMCDIDYLYQGNLGGLRADIGTAWGVTYPDPLPAGANLYTNAANMASVPSMLLYSDADAFITVSSVTAMASAASIDHLIEHDPDNLGHTEAGFAALGSHGQGEWKTVIDHIKDNGG